MSLLALFAPGRGRRRLTIPDLQCQVRELKGELARRDSLVEVKCMAGKSAHPVWWTVEAPGDCPWCVAERLALEVQFLRPTAPGGPLLMPAAKDMPGYGVDASTTTATRQDATLASLAETDADAEILSALGHSIPAPADVADTLLLDTSRLHGPSETAIMPAVPTGSVPAGAQRTLPAVTPGVLPPITWRGGLVLDPAVPQLKPPLPSDAITVATPVVSLAERGIRVRLAKDPKPLITVGAEVCTGAADHAVTSVHKQLDPKRDQLATTP